MREESAALLLICLAIATPLALGVVVTYFFRSFDSGECEYDYGQSHYSVAIETTPDRGVSPRSIKAGTEFTNREGERVRFDPGIHRANGIDLYVSLDGSGQWYEQGFFDHPTSYDGEQPSVRYIKEPEDLSWIDGKRGRQ